MVRGRPAFIFSTNSGMTDPLEAITLPYRVAQRTGPPSRTILDLAIRILSPIAFEMAKAEDMGRYFRIPADNRDLNYDKFIVEGSPEANEASDYTSHSTNRLDVEQVAALLRQLPYIRRELGEFDGVAS